MFLEKGLLLVARQIFRVSADIQCEARRENSSPLGWNLSPKEQGRLWPGNVTTQGSGPAGGGRGGEEGEGAAQQLRLEFGSPSPHRNPDPFQHRGHGRKAVEKGQEALARNAELFVDELSKVRRQRRRWSQRASPLTVTNLPISTQATPRPDPPLAAPLNLSFPCPHATHHVSEHLGLTVSPSLFPLSAATASLPAYSNFLPASSPSRDSSLSGSCHT